MGTLIPAAKILKIKKVLKAAGGAITVIKQVYTNYKYYRNTKKYSKTNAISQAVTDFSIKERFSSASTTLLKDFFSVSLIAGACGPLFTYNYKDNDYFFEEDNLKMLT